jgi:peptidoglycan/LPS O-acetylase OafA/YrhL
MRMRQDSIALTSIRGFAALWVVGYHFELIMAQYGYRLWPGMTHYGYCAVDIFFILSGFILTTVYRGLEWKGVGRFLTRRAFRIYPMHLAVLGVMLLVWLDAYLRFGVHNDQQHLRWLPICALLLQPLVYHKLMWNAVSWSVGVEAICYLLFPIVIMRMRVAPVWLIGLCAVAGAILEHHIQIYDLYVWGDGAVARGLVGFGLGMALRLLSERIATPSARTASLVELAALAGIAVALAIGQGAYVPLCGALLILGLSWESGIVAWGLNAGWCFWLGRISYSVYLIQEEVSGLIWPHFPASRLHLGHRLDGIVWTALVIGVILLLSTVTWYCIEEPFRRLGGRIGRRVEGFQPEAVPVIVPRMGGYRPESGG